MGGASLGLNEGSLQIAGARANRIDLRLQGREARATTAQFRKIFGPGLDEGFSGLLDATALNGELRAQLVALRRHFGH
jgi:hypothetical protein